MSSCFRIGLRGLGAAEHAASTRNLPRKLPAARHKLFSACARLQNAAAPSAPKRSPKSLKINHHHKPPNTVAKQPSSSPIVAPTSTHATKYAFVKTLASKPNPTTLYEGPPQFWFYFGCWTSGLTILGWTVLTGPKVVFQQPEGVAAWIVWVYGSTYVILAAMGFYLLSKTRGMVKSIRVIPTQTGGITTSAGAQPSLRMELTVNRALPFLAPRIISTTLDNVSLKHRFSLPEEHAPRQRLQELKRQEVEQRKAMHKFDMQHLLTMPFRQLGRAFVSLFRGVRAAWTDIGLGLISVEGKEYKVDVAKGFALEGFRTLERLVGVKS